MTTIGLIGVGHMGYALYSRMHKDARFILFNRTYEKIEDLSKNENTEVVNFENIEYLLHNSDFVMVGVQPADFKNLFNQIKKHLSPDKKINWISMAAALSLDQLYSFVPKTHKWLRIMPNTPVEIGEGFTSYTAREKDDLEYSDFLRILSNCGVVEKFDEKSLDIASTVAGCSPAYVYMIIEAMADAAVQHGLPRDKSYEIVCSVLKGSANMLLETGKHPGQLKDEVTSPSGTTIAGVSELEKAGLRSAIIRGVSASVKRGQEIHEKEK